MAREAKLPSDPVPVSASRGEAVRVVIPASVAFNIDQFTQVVQNLAERLGCKPCLSGRACFFLFERDFVVNPQSLELESGGVFGP